ncbi:MULTISPECIES: hypothetical protein [unclassified Coleofasciculus]|uniref:hypothetical protein n=1 Tax=unclassified Coleofasciculus TaxID=2692782 RepID=UPI00187E07B0|nr:MULTISPECIES: hypothetical protein [unclassified Coleofasciculus]MBE9125944.1 hypothetical protein [Coleofasciculus sp. LEGE 07081]MBE9149316.1 hypothetical protein [Coleofasciculus sp. LEGE 07092]
MNTEKTQAFRHQNYTVSPLTTGSYCDRYSDPKALEHPIQDENSTVRKPSKTARRFLLGMTITVILTLLVATIVLLVQAKQPSSVPSGIIPVYEIYSSALSLIKN